MLITPFGGSLVNLVVPPEAVPELRARGHGLPSLRLSDRALCDLELLATGGFSPLDRFMGRADFERVVSDMRLAGGLLCPMPITLTVSRDAPVVLDRDVALRDARNDLLGVMTVEEIYEWDRAETAARVLGTRDTRHPLVAEMRRWGDLNISGRPCLLSPPARPDFRELRLSPAQTRARLDALGATRVVAFQTGEPVHRPQEELTRRAAEALGGVLLLQPVVGMAGAGDIEHYARVRACKALVERYYDPRRALLALLPLATRMAGPREVLWRALVARNHGASHVVLGRDPASPGLDSSGRPFDAPDAAQELVERFRHEHGVGVCSREALVYLRDEDRWEEASRAPRSARTVALSEREIRAEFLDAGRRLPAWFTRPEVADILMETYPPRHRQGVCVWLTGLSGAGKSTTAELLAVRLLERGRRVTVLDGDVVRTHLSRGLGFGKEDRDTNIRRIGFVAAEIVRHGGVVLCAAVSPYRATRAEVRHMIGADRFVEVFVDTPLEVCERRDSKGAYARARRGEITGFTGIDDPYERPERPELILETEASSADDNARRVVDHLERLGFVRESPSSAGPRAGADA
jgi:sulfate adenylyltransferase